MKESSAEEIDRFNGKDGNPAYVAHRGKVYDVTGSKVWKGGVHMNRHHAGKDLTSDILAAPHDPSFLERYPRVGTLKESGIAEGEPADDFSRLSAGAYFLKTHSHPMTVHFPIAFTYAAVMFDALYLLLGIKAFEITALDCLGAGIFFTPIAIATGFYTWLTKYRAKRMRPVMIKLRLSFVLLATEIAAFAWRLEDPAVLDRFGWAGVMYLFLLVLMLVSVTIIGWFGASLTFPMGKPATGSRRSGLPPSDR
ncbi:MAG: cytochrome b5 [Deltaproteobacteria bacterium]|nr:cytochrome b5 [Deltaproteobacteria bacterium]